MIQAADANHTVCDPITLTAEERAVGRIGGRRKKLDPAKRREIAGNVISGRKTAAEMARLYNVRPPTVSRIVAAHRTDLALACNFEQIER